MSLPNQEPAPQAFRAFTAIGIVFLLCLTYSLGRGLYNLFFHPLRNFPGPKTWAWSRIPYTIWNLYGKSHEILHDLHENYGPMVRIAPDELSIIHPDVWKDVVGHRTAGRPENIKEPANILGTEKSVFGANLQDHSRMRRVLAHGFSMQAMADQQPLINTHVDLLLQRLHENCGQGSHALDMVSWYNRATFDVISDLAWGESLGCLASSKDHPWIHAMEKAIKALDLVGQARRFPPFSSILELFIPRDLKRLTEDNFAMAAASVEKRIQLGQTRPDFMESMIKQKGDREMSKEELVANGFILMLAGSDTSSTALAAVTYYLTLHPETLAKLTAEVDSTFKSEADINISTIQGMPYLSAVVDETLRINPVLPAGAPRIMHEGGDVVCGVFVPENTVISIPHYAMFRSSHNFTLPSSFIPERWLGDPRFVNDQREARKPFSFGPRNCIGTNLAFTEIRIILARMIWNFEMRLAEDSTGWGKSQRTWNLWERPPLYVYLTPRHRPGTKAQ